MARHESVALIACLLGVLACLCISAECSKAGAVEAWLLDPTGSLVFDAAQGAPSVRVTSSSQLAGKEMLFVTDQMMEGHRLEELLPRSVRRFRVVATAGAEESQFSRPGAVDVLGEFLGDVAPFSLVAGTHVAIESSLELSGEELQGLSGLVEELAGLAPGAVDLSTAATLGSWGLLEGERPTRGAAAAPLRYLFLPHAPSAASASAGAREGGVAQLLSVRATEGGGVLPLERRLFSLDAAATAEGEFSVHVVECEALEAVTGALYVSAPPEVSVFGLSACAAAADGLGCTVSSWSSGVRPLDGAARAVSTTADARVSLRRSMAGAGFHRTLATEGALAPPLRCSGETEVALVERLSVDFFVDEYQVTELFRFGARTETLLDHVIDLEKPAAQATQNIVVSYTSASARCARPLSRLAALWRVD